MARLLAGDWLFFLPRC